MVYTVVASRNEPFREIGLEFGLVDAPIQTLLFFFASGLSFSCSSFRIDEHTEDHPPQAPPLKLADC